MEISLLILSTMFYGKISLHIHESIAVLIHRTQSQMLLYRVRLDQYSEAGQDQQKQPINQYDRILIFL
ncbi:hypothetical protein SR76_23660 [Enterobacter hormaechei subsp. steigerwaltii]|nr:hypothetical protein SR76_23660 [Enterobacter hormaechei subsp. steigerwaltii]OBS89365.1 hypothetical protein AYL25_08165 [Enterobacter roggenkampii]